jgi:hypothetical protein
MTKKNVRRRRIGAEEFVTIWQTSSTIEEVALRLHEEETSSGDNLRLQLSARAYSLRRKGIPLKHMKKGSSALRLDVEQLANLAVELKEGI